MKTAKASLLALICGLALLASGSRSVAQGQEKREAPGKQGFESVLLNDTFKVLGSIYAFDKVVKGAPYSATAITETLQTLSDGNQIMRKNEARLYRDSEGRTRLEQRLESLGQWIAAGEAPQMIHINDPVTGCYYILDPRSRTALKGADGDDRTSALAKELELAKQKARQEMSRQEAAQAETGNNSTAPANDDPNLRPKKKVARQTEALGKQIIEGIEVEGARATLTIFAGQIGNTLPIVIVDESWYSPELQAPVLTKRHDPRSGDTTYRLTNINRSEPARALFEVPADYTLKNESGSKPKATKKPENEEQ